MTNKLSNNNPLMWRVLKEKIEMLDALISKTPNSYLRDKLNKEKKRTTVKFNAIDKRI